MKVKKIICIVFSLILLQFIRIGLKKIVFLFIERTLLTDVIESMIFMLLIIFTIIIILKKKRIDVNLLPKEFNNKYIIATVFVALFIITTPIITKNYTLFNILSLLYNAIITVVFEELIFRGIVYKELSSIKNDFFAYVFSTVLFGIWHLGYVDTVIWRTSIFESNANILNIMFWKVITGLVIGVLLGIFRYKNKNVYSSMLIHAFINTFGG